MSELSKPCPHCAEPLQPQAILCRFCDRGVSNVHYKNCPLCAEMVFTAARFCRYCKSDIGAQIEWPEPSRQSIWEKIKVNTGMELDDDAIEKIFERMSRKGR